MTKKTSLTKEQEMLVNEICGSMEAFLNEDQVTFLKIVCTRSVASYLVERQDNMLSVDIHDNVWILQRYTIDLLGMGRAENTIKSYVFTINRMFVALNTHYTKITGQMVMDWITLEGHRKNWGQNTKSNNYRIMSAFFGWAYNKKYIDEDVKRDLNVITPIAKKKDRLSYEEIESCRYIAGTLTPLHSALLETMLSLGCRVGELVALNIENVNFEKNEISIWGEKTQTWRIGHLSPTAKGSLKRYIGTRTSGPLFLNTRNNRINKHSVEVRVKEIGEKAGCHIPTTVHVYRKTFASIVYNRTQDIVLVSKLLGHATTATTIKCYLVDDIDDMMNRMKKVYI